MVKTILPNRDGGFSEQIVPLSHNRESGLKGSVVIRESPKFSRKQNGRKLQKVAENRVELKPVVFALFSQNEKSATRISSKLLIFSVDQVGLEPTTSRL